MQPRAGAKKPRDRVVPVDASGMSIALVVSRFNEPVTERLLAGATDALARAGARAADLKVVRVPGAWELPLVAGALARQGRFDAIVALGCVIRGETLHFELIARECARGLASVGLETGVPVGLGVLTTDTAEQALARAGSDPGNKGAEAARAAVEQVHVLRSLASPRRRRR